MANPFAAAESAKIYARGRPDHHPRTIRHLAALLPVGIPVDRALDVACGPGHSTRALQAIARQVIGVDVVPAMVEFAASNDDHRVAAARAEQLPFRQGQFALVVVASGVHWFDQDGFVVEARRVLTGDGVIAITEHFFLGQMDDHSGFADWMRDSYTVRFPPPRRGTHLSVTDDIPEGFEVIGRDGWLDPIAMSLRQLVDYFLTQSNTIAAIDGGRGDRPSVSEWLISELHPFFDQDVARTLLFWGSAITYRPHFG